MEKIALTSDTKLHWVQPKTFQRRYELRAGETLYATLEFQSAFGSLAVAASADGRWTFKRVGFFNPRVTLRKEGAEADLAVYRPNWMVTQGVLDFGAGRVFHWQVANFWSTRYSLSDSQGMPFLTYQSGLEDARLADLLKSQARVEIEPRARELGDLSLLVLLGWYLIVLQQEDSAAVVAATSASAG